MVGAMGEASGMKAQTVGLVYPVDLVCLVGRTGKPTRRTRGTRGNRVDQRNQMNQTDRGCPRRAD
jgi:hypothetical protein